ncbi:MAG TPA: transglycosylase domain-containing protein, partial [Meiothermus sp.]|nr:transglycosylase domain-containing protein [Meiothermus sp.]
MRAAGMLFLAALFGGLLAGGYLFYSWTRDLPTLEAFENLRLTATSTLYARDGTPIATIASVEDGRAVNRTLVRLSDVSPAAISAVVFSEDKRFYEHYGVDPVRLVGALYYIVKGDLQGGSTITTQVVKQTLLRELANERALERKLKEFPLALELERRYSKQEILEMYLNVVPWGGNAQGIQAAAEAYFGKDPAALTLAEGVYLAQLIPGPNPRYFDLKNSRLRIKRQLEDMVAEGWISQAEADAAWKQPLIPNGWQAKYDGKGNLLSAKLVDPSARVLPELVKNYAPHFVLAVRAELEKRFGKEKLYGEGGLQVYTSLDLKMQEAAERAVSGVRLPINAQLALAALDPETGQVLAMVGEKPGTGGQFNRATQAWRSPGSAIKPFVYGTALENGWTQATTVPDVAVEFRDPSQPGGVWRPKNFSGRFLNQPVTIRYALDQSLNLPAIRTADAVGVWKIGEKLKTAGFRLAGNANLSNAIGGGAEITPVGLAGAYAAFVNGGYRVEPVLITRVEDASGRVIYEPEDNRTLLFTPQVAYLVWDMLKGYVYDLKDRSLAPVSIPGRVVGGKTGTTNDATDLW